MSFRALTGFLLSVLFCVVVQAKKEVVFFGGGGEPSNKDTTIFDQSYEVFAPFQEGSGWDSRSYFNGGHAISDHIAHSMTGGKNKEMTTQNMNDEIASLKARIQNGDLKKGDQLMITLATHGLRAEPGKSGHSIATSDGQFDVNELKELRDLAEAQGVQLAIVDYSCHSGATLNLASNKTCIISAASDNVAYSNTGYELGRNMTKGSSLETAFLFGRMAKNPGTPQISTEAGQKTYAETKLLSSMMLHDSTLEHGLQSGTSCSNTDWEQYKSLIKQLRTIEKTQNNGDVVGPLEKATKNYVKAQQDAELAFAQRQKLNEKICYKNACGTRDQWQGVHEEVLEIKRSGEAMPQEMEDQLAAIIEVIQSSEHKKWQALDTIYKEKAKAIMKQAEEVASAERSVYQALYDYHSKNSKKPNPCRDFKI